MNTETSALFCTIKILILYYSKDGNTKKMAGHVLEGVQQIPGHEIRLRSVTEARQEDLIWCDGMAVGSPTFLGTVASEMKKFWEDCFPIWQNNILMLLFLGIMS